MAKANEKLMTGTNVFDDGKFDNTTTVELINCFKLTKNIKKS